MAHYLHAKLCEKCTPIIHWLMWNRTLVLREPCMECQSNTETMCKLNFGNVYDHMQKFRNVFDHKRNCRKMCTYHKQNCGKMCTYHKQKKKQECVIDVLKTSKTLQYMCDYFYIPGHHYASCTNRIWENSASTTRGTDWKFFRVLLTDSSEKLCSSQKSKYTEE